MVEGREHVGATSRPAAVYSAIGEQRGARHDPVAVARRVSRGSTGEREADPVHTTQRRQCDSVIVIPAGPRLHLKRIAA